MTAYRWDPFATLSRFDREFDQLVRRSYSSGLATPRTRVVRAARTARTAPAGFVPPVELVRDGSDVVVRAELPGIDIDKDVAVEVERGRLVIRGERHDNREDTTDGVLVREVRYGSFRREFSLPEGVSADAIEATYDAGILEVRVRGALQPVETAHRIPVTSGSTTERESSTDASATTDAPAADPVTEDGDATA